MCCSVNLLTGSSPVSSADKVAKEDPVEYGLFSSFSSPFIAALFGAALPQEKSASRITIAASLEAPKSKTLINKIINKFNKLKLVYAS